MLGAWLIQLVGSFARCLGLGGIRQGAGCCLLTFDINRKQKAIKKAGGSVVLIWESGGCTRLRGAADLEI